MDRRHPRLHYGPRTSRPQKWIRSALLKVAGAQAEPGGKITATCGGNLPQMLSRGTRLGRYVILSSLLLEEELRKRPKDPRIHSSLGIVYAGLGRKEEAIREGKLAVQLYPVSKDAMDGPQLVTNLAIVFVMAGNYDLALDQIEYLLSIPSFFSVNLLQLDPRYDPLCKHPRYAQLLEKYTNEVV
jgi:tetratricopeptide (TPR) repeat protein